MALKIPFNNPATYAGHSGVDFPQARGTIVRASGPGVVQGRWSNSRGGNLFAIKYDGYPPVYYAHLDNYDLVPQQGTRVNEGDAVCRVGNTGNSTGPHLHMEVEGRATTAGFWTIFSDIVVGGGSSNSSIYDQWGGRAWVTAIQQKLLRLGYDLGPWGADGDPGAMTQAAIGAFQEKWGLEKDNIAGPLTNAKMDEVLAIPTSGNPPFPLPAGKWFGPEGGGDNSISGWHSYNADLKRWQQRMIDRGWDLGPSGADGYYGAKGQTNPEDSYTGRVALAFQREKGFYPDGQIGPVTWDGAWTAPVTPPPGPQPEPEPEPEPEPGDKDPDIITPTAADFPSWIRYEEKFDQQWSADKAGWNAKLNDYYGQDYYPVESHTHWWNEPGKGGTHDGNVDYLNRTQDVGTNYVTSPGRVTLCMPLDQIALTTGRANPVAWKSENDPLITTTEQELGYLTLGALHYIVEKKNPRLRGEAVFLHKEKLPGTTSCSNIDKARVRRIADAFHSGELDIATGKPPVTEPEVPATLGEQIAESYRELGDLLEQLPDNI